MHKYEKNLMSLEKEPPKEEKSLGTYSRLSIDTAPTSQTGISYSTQEGICSVEG